MATDSDRGMKRSEPEREEMMGMLARLFENGGDDDDIELGLNMLVETQRQRVLMQVKASGEEHPVPEEAPFEWDLEGDYENILPQDAVYIDDLSGKQLSPELVPSS